MKPDFRSYFRRQFSKYPYIVKCGKMEQIFKEINGERHKLIYGFIGGGLDALFMLICILSREAISKMNAYLFALIYFSVNAFLILISRLIYIPILYKVSKFEIIDEKELDKYPDVLKVLKRV